MIMKGNTWKDISDTSNIMLWMTINKSFITFYIIPCIYEKSNFQYHSNITDIKLCHRLLHYFKTHQAEENLLCELF